MVKKDQVKKIKKGDVVTRFWYTLKNLDPSCGYHMESYLVATKLKSLVVKDVKVSSNHRIETYVVAIRICFLMFFLCPFFFVGFPPG
jgi:hypothetical protein